MWTTRRASRRSIIWLLLAVLLPLTALIVMQYRFLRKIEKTAGAYQRDKLKGYLELVAHDIEHHYRERADLAFDLDPEIVREDDALAMTRHFSKQKIEGAKYYFVRTLPWGGGGTIRFFHPGQGEVCPVDLFVDKAARMATAPWIILAEEFGLEPMPSLAVDEHDPINRIILKAITDEEYEIVGVAGVVLDQRAAKRALVDPLVWKKREDFFPGEDENIETKVVTTKIARSLEEAGESVLIQGIGFIFTDWSVTARFVGQTPEEIAAANFRVNMIWTSAVALLLLGSLLLTVRATAREMRLSQMKSDFVSNVSHELRTPLSSIRVFGEYMGLGRVSDPNKVKEYGRYIESEGRRLTQLINNILDFSKIESAEKEYDFRTTRIEEIVRSTVSAFETPLKKENAEVIAEIASDLPDAFIDRDAIIQVLMNLLDNAVKYSESPARVHVSVVKEGREIALAVRDSGVGISSSDQKKIFDKFFRVSTGLVHDVKGSGLGLAIVNHIVQAHGGRVEVASKLELGSTFTIFLPAASIETRGKKAGNEPKSSDPIDDGVGEPV